MHDFIKVGQRSGRVEMCTDMQCNNAINRMGDYFFFFLLVNY